MSLLDLTPTPTVERPAARARRPSIVDRRRLLRVRTTEKACLAGLANQTVR